MPDDTQQTLDAAYLELSGETGAGVTSLRDAALELAGHDAGSTFGSQAEEIRAVAALTQGLRDGSLATGRLSEAGAAAEHQRLAALHGASPFDPDPAAVKFDQHKLDEHLYRPQPATPAQRQPATLSTDQGREVDRLLSLSNDLRAGPMRPSFGSATGGPTAAELALSTRPLRADEIHDAADNMSARSKAIIGGIVALVQRQRGDDPAEIALTGKPLRQSDTAGLTTAEVTERITDGRFAVTRQADGKIALARGRQDAPGGILSTAAMPSCAACARPA